MSSGSGRVKRVAELVKRTLGPSLQTLARDHDLGLLSIIDVSVSPDLKHATVIYSILGPEQDEGRVLSVLSDNRPRLQSVLARSLSSRNVPVLQFRHDQSIAESDRIASLLRDQD